MNRIIPGSLAAIAQSNTTSVAESFLSADTIVLVDTSASMEEVDAVDEGRRASRYQRACKELTRLQATLAGKIAVISFSGHAEFCPGGIPTMIGQNTDLAKALRFAHVADNCDIQFVVISDGAPDDTDEALEEAAKYRSTISTVFIGPAGGTGEEFLQRLARASGGRAKNVQRLLTA